MGTMWILGGTGATGQDVSIGIEDGIQGAPDSRTPYLDATGLTVVPGFVDLQVNGAFGHDFTAAPESIWSVGERLPETGVTSFCPTIITAPPGAIEAAQQAMHSRPLGYCGAEPIGLHIEGPCLSRTKHGTHPSEYLRPPSAIDISTDNITLFTLAPELPGALELIERISAAGVIVAIGHSEATADQARAAIDAGASVGTHLLNAMPPITAREPGIAGVLLADPRTYFGVIVDGYHLDPATLTFVWNSAPNRFVAVTDAMEAAGMPDGGYSIGSVDVTLEDGRVRNQDGVLAGAASTMDRNLSVLMDTTGATLSDAVRAFTSNPAEAIGRQDLGRLKPGARGDVTLLDGTRVVAAVTGGRVAFINEPGRWIGGTHAAS